MNNRYSSEQIIQKYWIKPGGIVVDAMPEHQLYAWDYLGPKATKKFTKGKWQAEDALKKFGWIRVQIYSEKGLALEGLKEYLNKNGQYILEVLPDPRRVYISVWPSGETRYYGAEELDKIGWDALAKRQGGKKLFASLLRIIEDDVKPEDKLTFMDRWGARAKKR